MSAVFKSEEDEEEESMGWLRRNSRRLLSCEATRRFFRIKDLHSSEPMIRSISCFSVTVMFTRLSLNESLAALEKWIDKKNGEMKKKKEMKAKMEKVKAKEREGKGKGKERRERMKEEEWEGGKKEEKKKVGGP